MVELITNFTDFLTEVQNTNKHEVPFTINGKEYTVTYSEMSSQEDIKGMKEFEKWMKDNYPSLEKKEVAINAALDAQWRIWKMCKLHMKGMDTFDVFLALPPPVVMAIMDAIQEDMKVRYPHLKN